ncbi:hypothetical protein ANCCAN_02584 [Ancylostoma caninum]|uniref:Protein kinase domain-containing protein n=1 Tax=Ancylostoma caninum TaxID=29170 RepID=A0A368H3P0_ANCCA|nr:hypothetical protein ANCCAN_02584 [Ancylostoma caninum]
MSPFKLIQRFEYIELHFAPLPVMSDEEEDDLGIKPGTVIDSSKANYVVIKLLGEGGFGAVFKWVLPPFEIEAS